MEELNMRKSATSKKQKKSAMKSLKVFEPFKSEELKDKKIVIEVLFDCIRTGDLNTFREVLVAHLMTVNKMELAKRAGIGRRTLYDLIDPKKKFNPSLTTVSAVIRALAS
jgi:DNA-binding phage protein